jgi:hypothetical protein
VLGGSSEYDVSEATAAQTWHYGTFIAMGLRMLHRALAVQQQQHNNNEPKMMALAGDNQQ